MEGGGFGLMPRFMSGSRGRRPTPIFQPILCGTVEHNAKGWMRAGALWAYAQGFTSVLVPEPSTRLMSGSRGTHPDFKPSFCSTAEHHAGRWMEEDCKGWGLWTHAQVLPQFLYQGQVTCL